MFIEAWREPIRSKGFSLFAMNISLLVLVIISIVMSKWLSREAYSEFVRIRTLVGGLNWGIYFLFFLLLGAPNDGRIGLPQLLFASQPASAVWWFAGRVDDASRRSEKKNNQRE